MTLRYGSVCSGIEAASVAWHPLGWRPSFFSEIDPAPRAVLAHHWPDVPCHGDFTTIEAGLYDPIDLLVGGTPCQDFSVAGLRAGLDGERGNLTLEFGRLARRLRPRWVVWENVPGVLSSNGGRDFACVLGLLAGRSVEVPAGGWQNSGIIPGYHRAYGLAYRVLDAQYVRVDGFGRAVPQRRRRVFVVGYLGDWRRAAAVLLERACLRGDPAPRREAGAGAAAGTLGGAEAGGVGAGSVAALTAGDRGVSPDQAAAKMVVPAPIPILEATKRQGQDQTEAKVGTGIGQPGDPMFTLQAGAQHAIAFDTTQITSRENRANPEPGGPCHPLAAGAHPPAIAFTSKDHGQDAGEIAPTLRAMQGEHANAGGQVAVAYGIRSDASREGSAKTPSADAEGRVRLRDPGLGIYAGLTPTVDASQPHAVAYDMQNDSLDEEIVGTLQAEGQSSGNRGFGVLQGWAVRHLTPEECEALQGFPRGHTLVPWRSGTMPDGPRYKALGNSMAVNVMRWLGRRIETVEALFPSEFQ